MKLALSIGLRMVALGNFFLAMYHHHAEGADASAAYFIGSACIAMIWAKDLEGE